MPKTREYYELMESFGFVELQPMTQEETDAINYDLENDKPLPSDVAPNGGYTIADGVSSSSGYKKYVEQDFTQEEFQRITTLKLIKEVKTIKNCAIFFVVLTVISLVLSLIALAM